MLVIQNFKSSKIPLLTENIRVGSLVRRMNHTVFNYNNLFICFFQLTGVSTEQQIEGSVHNFTRLFFVWIRFGVNHT